MLNLLHCPMLDCGVPSARLRPMYNGTGSVSKYNVNLGTTPQVELHFPTCLPDKARKDAVRSYHSEIYFERTSTLKFLAEIFVHL